MMEKAVESDCFPPSILGEGLQLKLTLLLLCLSISSISSTTLVSFHFEPFPACTNQTVPYLYYGAVLLLFVNGKNLMEFLTLIFSPFLFLVLHWSRLKKMGGSEEHVTRVLFCGPHFPYHHLYTKEYLCKYHHIQVDDVPLHDLPSVIGNYDLCVPNMTRIGSDVVSRAKHLKLILQFGVGLEGVDVDAATKHGIKVARIPGDNTGNAVSCAEMAIYLMLGLLRKQKEMEISIKLKRLGEPAGGTLFGKTVFIMGYGSIGRELAKRLRPFDVKILATKRSWTSPQSNGSASQNDCVDSLVDEKGSHDDIYKFAGMADIVACCLKMNSETGAYLVNIARGGLLDYDAVAQHLNSGNLGGLGIDVAWTEPFDPNDPILQHSNVLITPHVAGVTEYSIRNMAKVVGNVALQLHEGKPLTGIQVVN